MSGIKAGTRVRVTFEGVLVDRGNAVDGTVIEAIKGDGNVLEATVPYSATIIELPPAEPAGRYALAAANAGADVDTLFAKRYLLDELSTGDTQGWQECNGSGTWYSWAGIVHLYPNVRVLFAGEPVDGAS